MRFETYISLRYLLTRQRSGVLSMITLISVGGVAVGVTALIIVISVMDGFDRDLIKKMVGIYSHIELQGAYGPIENYQALSQSLERHEEIIAAAPLIKQQALVQGDIGIETQKVGVMAYGIVPKQETEVSALQENLVAGSLPRELRQVMVGEVLAKTLGVNIGDKIYAVTKIVKTAQGPMTKTSALQVCGIFKSGWYQFDANLIYVTMETAQQLFLMDDVADVVHVKLKDPYHANRVKGTIEPYLLPGERYYIRSWDELSPDFFKALKLEKIAMFIILLLIVIVASFNIIGTLTMVVIEKTREIGILRSIGCGTREIMRIFLFQGMFIGVAGTALGVVLGLLGCYGIENWLHKIKYFDLPNAVYGIEKIPVAVSWQTTLIIVVSAMAVCVIASIVPAIQACRLKAVEALRYE